MRNLFLILALVPLITVAQNSPQAVKPSNTGGFTITGNISGLPKGAEVKLLNANTNLELATTTVVEKKTTIKKNGKLVPSTQTSFVLKGSIAEPDLCLLSISTLKPFNLYVENATITITGSSTDIAKWTVKGSNSHNDFVHFEKTFTPLAQAQNSLASQINMTGGGLYRDSLMNVYTQTQQKIQDQIDEFVTKRNKSYVSPFVVLVLMNFNDDPILAENRLAKLDPTVQASYLGKVLSQQIATKKIGAVGTQALEFTQADTSGTPVSLSSFRGKYVLVDFWASWCRPCRDENPNVVYNYQKFRDKNFTVLGVSLDRPGQKDKWIEAIKVDSLTWTHVSDLQFWNNEVARLYHIEGIPQNILVDPNGKIIGKNLRGPALEAKLCEVLGCN